MSLSHYRGTHMYARWGVLAALALFFSAGVGSAAECGLGYRELRAEALEVLRQKFPNEAFTAGKTLDVIRMGAVEMGLQNLSLTAVCGALAERHATAGGVGRVFRANRSRYNESQVDNPQVLGRCARSRPAPVDALRLPAALRRKKGARLASVRTRRAPGRCSGSADGVRVCARGRPRAVEGR